MKDERFKKLMTGARQALEHARGERHDLRNTVLPKPPRQLSSKEIAAIRRRMNASQALFARYLNISTKTIQSWEQGTGRPSGASLKLLSIASHDPEILLKC
jgi:putative transcriptional regulator